MIDWPVFALAEEVIAINRRKLLGSGGCATGAAVALRSARCMAAPDRSIEIGNEPQLLIDDWIVARRDRLRRTLHHVPQVQTPGLLK